jgi:hypothetical protein
MFGRKKHETPHFTPLTQQAGDEPVHIFDQTNGVLRHFEETTASPVKAGKDYEDTSNVITGGVIAGQMGGGFGQ